MLTLYFQFFSPTPEQTEAQKQAQKKQLLAKDPLKEAQAAETALKDSAYAAKALGQFAGFAQGKAQEVSIENDELKVILSTQGGRVKKVLLKKYQTFDKKPLYLEDEKSSTMALRLKTIDGKTLNLYQLFYQTDASEVKVSSKDKGQIIFKLDLGEGKSIEQIYSLSPKSYQLAYDLKIKGLEKVLDAKQAAEFYWYDNLKRVDSDLDQTRYYSTINYYTPQNGYNYLYWPSDEPQEVVLKENISWISFKQKFFSSALIAKNKNFSEAYLRKTVDLKNPDIIKSTEATMLLPVREIQSGKANFEFYFGPNQTQILQRTDIEGFEKNVHTGWAIFSVITRYLIVPIFTALQGITSNYGLIIILLVVILKVLVFPLSYRSHLAMAKMKVMNDILKPELDEYKEKNGLNKANLTFEEQQKVQQEQMRLYQQLGTSPLAGLSGCIPLLLQMPIFIALFIFFPNAIELRQQSFLWAQDLSTFDSILTLPFHIPGYGSHVSLFNILLFISTIGITYFSNQTSAQNLQGPMIYMMYLMPVMLLFVLNASPAGLNFYYFVQNVLSLAQQFAIKKYFVDETKIKAKFEEYKKESKNPNKKKKPTFTERLMELQKQQQAQIEAKKNKKNQGK
jgi:YidC/Oxa1 family membrane protein insertase